MSFVDPIEVAAHSPTPALTFARVGYGVNKSSYIDLANGYTFKVEHSDPGNHGKKTERHYARIEESKDVTLPSGAVVKQTASVSLAVSVPPTGWTSAQKEALIAALAWTMQESEVTYAKFVNYET